MTIAMMVKHALDGGYQTVEVAREAEDAWLELLSQSARYDDRLAGLHARLLQQRRPGDPGDRRR